MNETTANPLKADSHSVPDHTRNMWVDGSSRGNPGPSGWAVLLDGQLHSGHCNIMTNNEAEMIAVYEGIKLLSRGDTVTIHTDSKLVIGWFCHGWQMNNPRIKSIKKLVDQLVTFYKLVIRFVYTPGHAGIIENERVNAAAQYCSKWARSAPCSATSP